MNPIKVLIADSQNIAREGLKTIINYEKDMEVVAMVENGVQVYDKTVALNPHVILMDILIPQMNGMESIRTIRRDFPKTLILVLTSSMDEEDIVNALYYGADGYLLKDISGKKLVQCIRDAVNGEFLIQGNIAKVLATKIVHMCDEPRKRRQLQMMGLSERERQVALMVAEGMTNSQIASTLYISKGTVKNYISTIYSKVGISDRSKAVDYLKEFVV